MKTNQKLTKAGLTVIAACLMVLGSSAFSNAEAKTVVVLKPDTHICRFEERPVTRTYTDWSGGTYTHTTYETVRVCTHAPVTVVVPPRVVVANRCPAVVVSVAHAPRVVAHRSHHHHGHKHHKHHGRHR